MRPYTPITPPEEPRATDKAFVVATGTITPPTSIPDVSSAVASLSDISEDDSGEWTAVSIPELDRQDPEQRLDLLLLAWIYFLYRGASIGGDIAQSWGVALPAHGRSATAPNLTGLLTNVVAGNDEDVAKSLEVASTLRRQLTGAPGLATEHMRRIKLFASASEAIPQEGNVGVRGTTRLPHR